MRVLLVTGGHGPAEGGLTTAVQDLARHAVGLEHEVTILCTGGEPVRPPSGVRMVQCETSRVGRRWGWSPRLFSVIKDLVRLGSIDVVHVHGVWGAAQWYAPRRAWAEGIPFVLSAHGMLEPYHWDDRGLGQLVRKRAYWSAMAFPILRHAQIIHAITPPEARNLVRLFPGKQLRLVPNAVDLDEIDQELQQLENNGPLEREPTIAFIGRFHQKKGLELLIEAFSRAELPQCWRLKIAGVPGVPDYMAKIERALSQSSKHGRIDLLGPLFGRDKWRFLRTSSVLAAPSFSEVVGLVNLEAAACGTPTITTRETGLEDWEDGGGMLVAPEIGALCAAIESYSGLSAEEHGERSRASRVLVESKYSWGVISSEWRDLYSQVGSGAEDTPGSTQV